MPTPAVGLLLVACTALCDDEQEALYERLTEFRLQRLAAGEGETARHIASLRKVVERVGRTDLGVDKPEREGLVAVEPRSAGSCGTDCIGRERCFRGTDDAHPQCTPDNEAS